MVKPRPHGVGAQTPARPNSPIIYQQRLNRAGNIEETDIDLALNQQYHFTNAESEYECLNAFTTGNVVVNATKITTFRDSSAYDPTHSFMLVTAPSGFAFKCAVDGFNLPIGGGGGNIARIVAQQMVPTYGHIVTSRPHVDGNWGKVYNIVQGGYRLTRLNKRGTGYPDSFDCGWATGDGFDGCWFAYRFSR